MVALLGLLALGGLLFGLVNLVRPLGRLGISTRRGAGSLAGASLGVLILAAALGPSDPSAGEGDAPATTAAAIGETPAASPGSAATSTSVGAISPPTPDPPVTPGPTTTEASAPGAGTDSIFGPPAAGPSGDPGASLASSAERATVASITDGDTIQVVLAGGSHDTVRLIGINSPERGECWALDSARVLEALIPVGTEIGMTSDRSDRDRFERLLRYLWVGSMSVNEELVRRGAAISRHFPPDTAMSERFDAAQADARDDARGLWASDACGDPARADIRIIELRYDAAGNDNENLNDEWIRIRNDGDGQVDMTGWGIKDESATNRYGFPSGLSLAPGEVVTVFSGCGDDVGTSLFWCSVGAAVWNNDGDTAFLLDPAGNTHYSWSYTG